MWKDNYKAMNAKQIEQEILYLSSPTPVVFKDKEARLAFLAIELNLKKDR